MFLDNNESSCSSSSPFAFVRVSKSFILLSTEVLFCLVKSSMSYQSLTLYCMKSSSSAFILVSCFAQISSTLSKD